jgi:hypothetical protein
MNTFWQVPVILTALLSWLSTPPTSLGDAADRERLRRLLTPQSVAAYTNLDLALVDARSDTLAAPTSDRAGGDEAAPAGSDAGAAEHPGSSSAAAADMSPAALWRQRMTDARSQLEQAEAVAATQQERVNLLKSEVVNRDDPIQQSALRQQLQEALAELDRSQMQIIALRQQISRIQDDARQSGVPPGWVR